MKKGSLCFFVFLLFVSVFFISFISADFFGSWFDENSGIKITGQVTGNAVASSCVDSDSGKNYFAKGTTSGIDAKTGASVESSDSCADSKTLIEYFCDADSKVDKIFTACSSSGCSAGICRGTAPTPESFLTPPMGTTPSAAGTTTPVQQPATIPSVLTPTQTIPQIGNLRQTSQQQFQGYIVELKEEPLVVKNNKLKQEAKINEAKGLRVSPRTSISRQATLPSNVNAKLNIQKTRVRSEHSNFRTKAAQKLSSSSGRTTNSFLALITGKATSTTDLKIMAEYNKAFNGFAMNITKEQAESLKTISEVKSVTPNYKVNITLSESVPLINADDVWQIDKDGNNCATSGNDCLTGKGITIGIIDTGVDYTHPDLGSCAQTVNINDGSCLKVIGGYDFVNNDNDPMDDNGHGTHVAATAAGNGILKGVAPDAKIVGYKVLDSEGSGYVDDIIAAIERSVDPNQDGDFSDHLDVISLSLGGEGNPDDPMSLAIDNAVDSGVVAVIAAGNSGDYSGTIRSPGTSRNAITVGASDKQDAIAYFSSKGPVSWTDAEGNKKYLIKPDVTAPGVNICAAQSSNKPWGDRQCLDAEHVAISGTSMATPHVSGAVALLLQKNPDWTPGEIKMALRNTAVDLKDLNGNSYGVSTQGYGRIDVLEAISLSNIQTISDFGIVSPLEGIFDVYDKLDIKGIFPESYSNLILEYKKIDDIIWLTSGITVVRSSNLIAEFNPQIITSSGYYEFRAILTKENRDFKDSIKLYFDTTLPPSWKEINAPILPPLNIADIDNDGYQELIAYSKDGYLYAWNHDGSLVQGWPVFTGELSEYNRMLLHLTSSSPTIGDLDNDGVLEIVVGGLDGRVYVFEPDGILREGWPTLSEGNSYSSTPTLGDLDNDGNLEVVILGGGVHIFNSDGSNFGYFSILGSGGPDFSSSPSIGDLNNDGNLEIVFGTSRGTVEAIHSNGRNVVGFPVQTDPALGIFSTPALGDLDNDGFLEIVIGARGSGLYVIDYQGNIKEGWPYNPGGFFSADGDPSLFDFDNDGNLEIVFGMVRNYESSGLPFYSYVFDKNGVIKEGWPKKILFYDFGGAFGKGVFQSLGDINGDGISEIISITEFPDFVIGSNLPKISIWDFNGNEINGGSKSIYPTKSPPLLTDFNGDGEVDLILAAQNKIYILKFDVPYNSSNMPWPMFQHDPQHTGCYDCDKISTASGTGTIKTCEQTRTLTRQTNPNLCAASETRGSVTTSSECTRRSWLRCTQRTTFYSYTCTGNIETSCSANAACLTGIEIGSKSCDAVPMTQKTCEQTRTLTRQTNPNLCAADEKIDSATTRVYRECRMTFLGRCLSTRTTYYYYNCVKTTTTGCSADAACLTGSVEKSSVAC